MKRLILSATVVLSLLAGAFVAIVIHNLSLISKEFRAADSFLETARERARALEAGEPVSFACAEPLTSRHRGKAVFGTTDFVALIAAPGEEQLPWREHPSQQLVGSNACSFAPGELEAIRVWNTFGRQAKDLLRSRTIAREGMGIHDCMNSALTDFGVVLVPHLQETADHYEGRVDVEIFDFTTKRTLCRGSAQVALQRPEANSRDHDSVLAAEFSNRIAELIAAAPEQQAHPAATR